jgi:O-antigen/teichoic acid export membrane protein
MFLFAFLASLATFVLTALQKQKDWIQVHLWITLINILGNLALIPYFSYIWSAIITVISQFFLVILLRRTLPLPYQVRWTFFWGLLTTFCIATFAAYTVSFSLQALPLFLNYLLSWILYCLLFSCGIWILYKRQLIILNEGSSQLDWSHYSATNTPKSPFGN